MKPLSFIFRGRSLFDIAGLCAVLGLFVVNAFHFDVSNTYVYYRELFGALFVALIAWHFLIKPKVVLGGVLRLSLPLFYLLLFPLLLLIWAFIDPGTSLYGSRDAASTTLQLSGASQTILTLYVLRNALLYLPMVLYLYLRGLNTQEIRLVALTAILIAPLSISGYLQSGELARMGLSLGRYAELGGSGIAYNSYVPYLTFHVLCGVYLLFSPGSRLIKVPVLGCVIFTSLFVVFSTSRQSTLFVGILFLAFYLAKDRKRWINKHIYTGFLVLTFTIIFLSFTQYVELAETFIRRFGSLGGFISTHRVATATHGLAILSPIEWFAGAGLTSVITSGPHNDYVRWTQRVGIPLMIFGFLPYLMTFFRTVKLSRVYRSGNTLYVFLSLAVGFTLFHSIFSYPREEANQSVAVYMGIAIWFGAYREGLLSQRGRSTKKALRPANRDSNHAMKSYQHPAQ